MHKLIEFYLTGINTLVIAWIVLLISLFLTVDAAKHDRSKTFWSLLGLNVVLLFGLVFAGTSTHYEPDSSSKWAQVYPTKGEYSTVFLKFDNLELLGDTATSPKTLEKLEDYAHYTNLYDLYDGSIILTTKDGKEERKVLLSRDNKLPKDVTNNNVVIDKIEYRKIDGVKKHLGKYTGQLEKRDVTVKSESLTKMVTQKLPFLMIDKLHSKCYTIVIDETL